MNVDTNLDQVLPELLPCPFCGDAPTFAFIGSPAGKRKAIVKCPECGAEQRTGAVFNNNEWLVSMAVRKWNKRTN